MTRVTGYVVEGFKRFAVAVALLGVIAMWLYSHVYPERLGSCREVPVNLGAKATVRDCQAYGTSDFIVPLAIVFFVMLLLSSADIELTIPGLGTIKRTREGKEAAAVLKQGTDTLDQRGEKFLDALPNADASGAERPR